MKAGHRKISIDAASKFSNLESIKLNDVAIISQLHEFEKRYIKQYGSFYRKSFKSSSS